MILTAEQVAAAEAAGCRFVPVPPDALNRFAMQRKLFRLPAGQEVLATRGGGLYETASTLEKLIAEGRALLPAAPVAAPPAEAEAVADVAAAEDQAAAEVSPAEHAPAVEASPAEHAPTIAAAREAEPTQPPADAPRRKPRTRRPPAAAAEPTVAPVLLPVVAEAAVTPRPRKQPEQPRWATAGAERRGRAEQHWSRRGR